MGRGKSEWLKNMFYWLMQAGVGFMGLDCKGTDLVNGTLPIIPLDREKDVIIVKVGGTWVTGQDMRVNMNMLSPRFGESLGLEFSQLSSTILQIFSTLDPKFEDAPGMQQFAQLGLLALLEGEPNPTLMHLVRFFGDEEYRAEVCANVKTMPVKNFWAQRFDQMPESQKASLTSFERRLDQLLNFPELAAMLVSRNCSVDLRKSMDTNGIVLVGIKATEGKIASIAVTLLLTQVVLAAMSRSKVSDRENAEGFCLDRPDWPMVIDEVQIVAKANEELFKVMLSQFRAFRIGMVLVHQNLGQLAPAVLETLAGNAQSRVILGTEPKDARIYESLYNSIGLTASDLTQMRKFRHQYLKLYSADVPLMSSQPLPQIAPLQEPEPEPVYRNFRAIRAEARSTMDQKLDTEIARFQELAATDYDRAVAMMGQMSLRDPEAFDALCSRTAMHREAQRNFILEHPGCIALKSYLPPEEARRERKIRRIEILSTLKAYTPRIESDAMIWALLTGNQEAFARKTERMAAEKEAKAAAKRGGNKGQHNGAKSPVIPGMAAENPAPQTAPLTDTTPLPTLKELSANRKARGRRDIDDISAGFEELIEVA
jgi:hypothetical protein